jgi:hypothetical protein
MASKFELDTVCLDRQLLDGEKGEYFMIISGNVSAEVSTGETVTITVTKPDGTTQVVTCQTGIGGMFSTTYSNLPGNYSEVPSIAADNLYSSAVGASVPFTISPQPRTITSSVS